MKPVMSIIETAKEFGLGRDRLRYIVRTDPTVPKLRIGKSVKINTALFQEWLDQATREGRQI